MRALMSTAILSFLLALVSPARAADAPDAPTETARMEAPTLEGAIRTEMEIGFYINSIHEVNLRDQSFIADFYLWIVHQGRTEEESKRLEHFEFMNGRIETKEENDRVVAGGKTYVCWRIGGTYYFDADLRRYPFDTQRMPIIVEHAELETDSVVFADDVQSYKRSPVPERIWGVRSALSIPEFRLISTRRTSTPNEYETDFGNRSRVGGGSVYSRFTIEITFARDFMPYFFKIIVPLAVIVAMAYLMFLLPPKEIQTASGLGITALLSTIAFNVSVGQNLPEVGYMVVSDQFFLLTYALLFLSLLQAVIAYSWSDSGQPERAVRWLKGCRFVAPVLYVASFGWLLANALS